MRGPRRGAEPQRGQDLVPYEVGYSRPPVQHRFRKGQSGNPGGRPRKPKAAPVGTGFGMRAAEGLLKKEAYRMVTIREGDELIKMPALQAVFRAMGVAAVKGNRFVQKTLAEMIAKVEAQDYASRLDHFEHFVTYKREWTEELERHRRLGVLEPDPIPHPDDVILDPDTGDVKVLGPLTQEKKQRLDEVLKRRSQAQEEVIYFAGKWRRARNQELKASYLEDWHWEQRVFDIINDSVGPRYKAKLENRSYAEGASREGTALDEVRRSKAMRKEYFE